MKTSVFISPLQAEKENPVPKGKSCILEWLDAMREGKLEKKSSPVLQRHSVFATPLR